MKKIIIILSIIIIVIFCNCNNNQGEQPSDKEPVRDTTHIDSTAVFDSIP